MESLSYQSIFSNTVDHQEKVNSVICVCSDQVNPQEDVISAMSDQVNPQEKVNSEICIFSDSDGRFVGPVAIF